MYVLQDSDGDYIVCFKRPPLCLYTTRADRALQMDRDTAETIARVFPSLTAVQVEHYRAYITESNGCKVYYVSDDGAGLITLTRDRDASSTLTRDAVRDVVHRLGMRLEPAG
jgi:hypothetical protein